MSSENEKDPKESLTLKQSIKEVLDDTDLKENLAGFVKNVLNEVKFNLQIEMSNSSNGNRYNDDNHNSEALIEQKRASELLEEANKKFENEKYELDKKIRKLTDEKTELETKNNKLAGEKSDLESKHRNLTDEKAELESKYKILSGEKSDLEAKFRNLTDEKTELESKYKILSGEKSDLESKIRNLTGEKTELESKNKILSGEKSDLESKFRNLTNEKTELEGRNKKLSDEKSDLESKFRNITDEKSELENKNKKLWLENSNLEERIKNHYNDREGLENKNKKLADEKSNLEVKIKNLTDDKTELEIKNKNIADEKSDLEAKIINLTDEKIELENQIKQDNERINILEQHLSPVAELEEIFRKIMSLNESCKNYIKKLCGGLNIYSILTLGRNDNNIDQLWHYISDLATKEQYNNDDFRILVEYLDFCITVLNSAKESENEKLLAGAVEVGMEYDPKKHSKTCNSKQIGRITEIILKQYLKNNQIKYQAVVKIQ